MAQPFKSQLFPTSLLSANSILLTGCLTIAGFIISRSQDFLHTLANLDIDPYAIATQAIQQLIQL